jgi:micrococcal nuclease
MKKFSALSLVGILFLASFGMIFWLDSRSTGPQVLGEKINGGEQLTVNSEKGIGSEVRTEQDNAEQKNKDDQKTEEAESVSAEKVLYTVARVVDGETIDVNIDGEARRVRLIGVNMSEAIDPFKSTECLDNKASEKLKELLTGQKVSIAADDTQGDKDIYGQLLRYVRREDGLFINKEMIKQGYAYEYTYKMPYQHQSDFRLMQRYAQAVKIGLWADGVCAKTGASEK